MQFVKKNKSNSMKPQIRSLLFFILIFMLSYSWMNGQEKKQNYGNVPDELVAFDKYQKS